MPSAALVDLLFGIEAARVGPISTDMTARRPGGRRHAVASLCRCPTGLDRNTVQPGVDDPIEASLDAPVARDPVAEVGRGSGRIAAGLYQPTFARRPLTGAPRSL
ncbi:MAG: hypothetical protein J0H11_01465 [Rhizobiales bacterium]|nr:hypothetical protein [Hyphomicrobiales bacterium]